MDTKRKYYKSSPVLNKLVVVLTNSITSLSSLTSDLSKYVTAGDQMQIGQFLSYCVVGGLETYEPKKYLKKVQDIKSDEIRQIYDFSSGVVEQVSRLSSIYVLKELGGRLNEVIERLRKEDSLTGSVLLSNIARSVQVNKGAISGHLAWQGVQLLNIVNASKLPHRLEDAMLQDYASIVKVMVKSERYAYGVRK